MRASIIGIGSELTAGQILNRNGQWLSKRLLELGVRTNLHLVIPDDRPLILEAFAYAAKFSELLFITGGLGPTSDDFTRDLVSEWTQTPNVFDEPTWGYIQERLTSRGIAIHEFQKQQCYFPVGARILENSNGTAHGFYLKHQSQQIFVLPGPPNEIAGIWQDHIARLLAVQTVALDRLITKSWDCLGVSESTVADLTETCLRLAPEELQLEIGYRVHLPYVEVKVSYHKSMTNMALPWLERLDLALMPLVVLRDFADAAELLIQKLENFEHIWLEDNLSGGRILNRLHPFLGRLLETGKFHYGTHPTPSSMAPKTISLRLTVDSTAAAKIYLATQNQIHSDVLNLPELPIMIKERQKQYFAERALLFWLKNLQNFS